MLFGIPLAIYLGVATIISVFITASFGIAMHVYKKDVFNHHKFFAFTALTLAVIHAVFAFMLYYGIYA